MTFTKEQLIEQAKSSIERYSKAVVGFPRHLNVAMDLELARIALASLEAEPVSWIIEGGKHDTPCHFSSRKEYVEAYPDRKVTPLYATPPAPVSVPECFKRLLHHAYGMTMGHDWNKGTMAGHHRTKLCQAVEECRAAMLQGAEQQNRQQNIPENIPVTQFKPVADLYGLTSSNGGETSFTFDAVEARDFIDGGWLCQEYVTLERYQEAMLQGAAGNSPAIPDGWVACSERIPDADGNYWGWWSESKRQGPVWFIKSELQAQFQSSEITHWMPLPAAPQHK